MSKILVAKNIHRVYQDGERKLHVLKGVDLSLDKNKIMMILGSSGCGKSTLLHILGALDKPTEGEVFLEDVPVYDTKDAARSRIRNRRIGFIFQFYHLLPEFDALENVMMPGLISSQSSAKRSEASPKGTAHSSQPKERARELLGMVGLKDRINHRPSELSGGEAQRVAIARALINKPDVVLCDEPTGNLDYENSMAIFELIRRLNKEEGVSFIIVTHEHAHAKFSDNVMHLVDGRLQ